MSHILYFTSDFCFYLILQRTDGCTDGHRLSLISWSRIYILSEVSQLSYCHFQWAECLNTIYKLLFYSDVSSFLLFINPTFSQLIYFCLTYLQQLLTTSPGHFALNFALHHFQSIPLQLSLSALFTLHIHPDTAQCAVATRTVKMPTATVSYLALDTPAPKTRRPGHHHRRHRHSILPVLGSCRRYINKP